VNKDDHNNNQKCMKTRNNISHNFKNDQQTVTHAQWRHHQRSAAN